MNEYGWTLGVVAFMAGLAGALAGAVVAWRAGSRRIVAQWPAEEMAQLRQCLEDGLQAETALHQALQRAPQVLRQQIREELEFLATQQVVQDQVRSEQQACWLAEQAALMAGREERHAADLTRVLNAIAAGSAAGPSRSPAPRPRPPEPTAFSAAPSVSARPPELLLTPIVHPPPVAEPEAPPERELTDEEIDALPPELPPAGPPRKRILPRAPKPTLRNI